MPRNDQLAQPDSAARSGLLGRARVVIAVVCLAETLTACGLARSASNEDRLHVLQQDPVLRCTDGLTPNGVPVDRAGTTHGIGFGATAATSVQRNFLLSADANQVAEALVECATKTGWAAARDPVPKPSFMVVRGHKQFEGGWTADLRIYLDQKGLIALGGHDVQHGPTVSLQVDTAPV